MAPQVGLEPTTDRLTADSSTTELLWNNMNYVCHKCKVENSGGGDRTPDLTGMNRTL